MDDLDYIIANLRLIDKVTLWAVHGHRRFHEIVHRMVDSTTRFWIYRDVEPVAIIGVTPLNLLSDTAAPWMLGTDRIARHPISLVRSGRAYTAQMLDMFPHLENHVFARDLCAVKWLRHLGFTIWTPEYIKPTGAPFCRFEMRRQA